MTVLIVVDKFPVFSETFIRNQIVALLDKGVNVYIYPKHGVVNLSEIDALKGFEHYQFEQRVIDLDAGYEKFKLLRFIKAFTIIISRLFHKNFKYYKASLNVKQYGSVAKSLRLVFRVHNILRYNIDVIHAHFGPNGERFAIFKKMELPIKLFTTFHGYDIRLGIKKGGHIYEGLFKYADGIIAISDYNKQYILSFGLDSNKLITLANGIDVDFFRCEKERPQGLTIKLLTVARLVSEKNLRLAIIAVSEVFNLQPDINIEYTIVGDGVLKKELQELIDTLKMQDKITLVGSKTTEEVRTFMHSHHLFVLSSNQEVLPTVLLEAQAAEMIVLATDVGSVRSIVNGGIVVIANDVMAFRDGLETLISRRFEWNAEGVKGRDLVMKHYDIKVQIEKLITIYKKNR